MKKIYTIFLVLGLLYGCDKPEATPAYLRINAFTVGTLGNNNLHEITDGWVYVNNDLIGGFSLPAEIPILAEGNAEIQVFPGIKANGLTTSPSVYPMMNRFTQTVALRADSMTIISPTTNYDSRTTFGWDEDKTTFDGAASIAIENRDADLGSSFSIDAQSGVQGKGILMQVDTAHSIIEIATEALVLPNTGNQRVWLELQHNNDISFSFQVLGVAADGFEEGIPIYFFNPTQDGQWNKIYIDLTDFLVNLKRPSYRLFFRVQLPVDINNVYTALTGKVTLDNIRVIHF